MTQQIYFLAITLKKTQCNSPSEQSTNIPGWEQRGKLSWGPLRFWTLLEAWSKQSSSSGEKGSRRFGREIQRLEEFEHTANKTVWSSEAAQSGKLKYGLKNLWKQSRMSWRQSVLKGPRPPGWEAPRSPQARLTFELPKGLRSGSRGEPRLRSLYLGGQRLSSLPVRVTVNVFWWKTLMCFPQIVFVHNAQRAIKK